MSEATWVPGLVILGVGLAFGLFLALRLKGGGKTAVPQEGDLDLRLRDLEQRRDDLYERIRRIDRGIDTGDKGSMEIAAARTLWEIDQLEERLPGQEQQDSSAKPTAPAAKTTRTPSSEAEVAAEPGFMARHPLATGFLFGAGMVALVGMLIYWAVQDAQPGERMAPEPGGAPQQAADPQAGGDLSERLDALKARLEANPNDIMAKKEIGLILMEGGKFVEAYEVAAMILAENPGDPDAQYIQGVVRLRMGQSDEALQLFDQVLANFPQHAPAMLYRGLALYQGGNKQQAMDTWDFALDKVGSIRPQIEMLMGMVEHGEDPLAALGFQSSAHPAGDGAGSDVDPIAAMAERAQSAPPRTPPPPAQAAPAPRAAPTSGGNGYPLRIELAAGATPPEGATLFVFLRAGEGGPPIAAKRLSGATFPLDLQLSAADSMMGAALPTNGIVTVRLDQDGSASTDTPGDLAGTAPAAAGQTTQVVLGG